METKNAYAIYRLKRSKFVNRLNDFHNQKRADILWRSFDYKSTWRFHFIHDWEKWNIVRIGSICIDSTIEFYPDERTKPF